MICSIDRWLVPLPVEKPNKKMSMHDRMPHQLTAPYLKNNYVFLSFLTAYVALNVGLFISRAIQYRESNIYVIIARACGINTNTFLNISFFDFNRLQPHGSHENLMID